MFLNGIRLGLLDGFMEKGNYDITNLLKKSGKNVLAVLVYWPTKPIANHASPTYISSDGWDWMPSVPGLLQGITDDVYLIRTGKVQIKEPWIITNLISKKEADVSLKLELKNSSEKEEIGLFTVVINPGNIKIEQPVKLNVNQTQELTFNTTRFKQLKIENPLLWWPNGYGDPNLYTCDLQYTINGIVSDQQQIKFGIKKYSYDTIGSVLHIKINGEKIFVKGGNWGMSEYMLRCRGEEYDLKVKLHRDMNFNIIRNWIGSVTDEEFYDACDKYGIMVWDDFWLNSHPNFPDDIFAFNKNAVEKIKRLRNHPSVAVWCGDNEGYPLPPLNNWLREDVKTFDGGERLYQPNSHADALTGSGPWTNASPSWYFTKYPGGFGGDPGWGFRTEIGTAVFTNVESFKKFMPDTNWWPRNQMWDKHFFGPSAGNGGPDRYFSTIKNSYGGANGIEDFCRKAQLLNIETNKALFEGWQHHMWDDASGVMLWMSQSAYPSFVWQTYDYYYDLNGAYWGVKKACEPVHIQWSSADNTVKVSNTSLKNLEHLNAEAKVYNSDGKLVNKYTMHASMNVKANSVTPCFTLQFKTSNALSGKDAVASSVSADAAGAMAIADANNNTRWCSNYTDNEWVYEDLGEEKEISSVILNWESAYALAYKLQVSTDAVNWKDVYVTDKGIGGTEQITFSSVRARYVKMQGIKRATQWGYSLYEIEVYGGSPVKATSDLSAVHFIKLLLTDETGKLLSDNVYWRGSNLTDYTALNNMAKAKLKYSAVLEKRGTQSVIIATITNTADVPAVAIHIQAFHAKDKERILPVFMNDNYFTLMKNESKKVEIIFDTALLNDGKYTLVAEPYNN